MKQFLLFVLIAAPVFSGYTLYAKKKGQERIDSLVGEIAKAKEDTNKVKLLDAVSYFYYSINPDEGIRSGTKGLTLAENLKWKKGTAIAYEFIGTNYLYKSAYTAALNYYDTAITLYRQLNDNDGVAGCLGNIGYTYTLSGDLKKALDYDLQALKMFEKSGNKSGRINTLGNIGSMYMNKGDYPNALDYTFKALQLNEETGAKVSIASNYGTLGSIYTLEKDYPRALDYYSKALKLNTELGKKSGMAGNYANIGSVYTYQYEYQQALEYSFKALTIYDDMGAKTGQALVLGNISQIYGSLHNYTQSIAFVFKALNIARQTGDRNAEAGQLGIVGESYLHMATDTVKAKDLVLSSEFYPRPLIPDSLIPRSRQAKLLKAKEYISNAIAIEIQVGNLDYLQTFYHNLATTDSLLGDYKNAMGAFEQYMRFNDSVYNGETKIKITNLETERALELKDKQIELDKLAVAKKHNERIFYISGIVLLLLVILFMLRNFFTQKRSNLLLSKEKDRSEELLLNILPAEVANELKNKGSAEAKLFDNVTVIFTDFVNFTQAGERMSPQELIDELHTCFKAFDEITGRHNIEKIKTIGDAYLAVGGLPAADSNHAENVVRAAIEINAFMNDRLAELTNKTFEIRIGVHSGSVVAGIVGVKKFAYDIWGDTVNTAARMEQNSTPGKINISETTYDLVKNTFTCEYRGKIDVKNKGQMKMYFVSL